MREKSKMAKEKDSTRSKKEKAKKSTSYVPLFYQRMWYSETEIKITPWDDVYQE